MNYPSKVRVLFAENQIHSARSYYRSRGVFPYFPDNYEFKHIGVGQGITRFDIMDYDIFFFGGKYDNITVTIAQWAKEQGKKVVVDYDDDLFTVTPENKTYHIFSNPNHVSNVKKILALSDLCFVTVDALKAKYEQFCDNVVVIPNCINDNIIDIDMSTHSTAKSVLWRGSDTHMHEVDVVTDNWIALMRKYPDWKFFFKGYHPYKIMSSVSNAIPLQSDDLFEYFLYLQNSNVSLLYIPLRNGVFNDSKSNIAWQDATLAGASAIVPNYGGQWHSEPYAYGYDRLEDSIDTLETAMRFKDDSSMFESSRRLIKEKYLLSEWNKVRIAEMEKLLC